MRYVCRLLEVSLCWLSVVSTDSTSDWKIQLWHIYEAYDGLAEIYEEPDVKYPFSLGKPYSGEFNDGRIVSYTHWPYKHYLIRSSHAGLAI